jgi:hypothetical protein
LVSDNVAAILCSPVVALCAHRTAVPTDAFGWQQSHLYASVVQLSDASYAQYITKFANLDVRVFNQS